MKRSRWVAKITAVVSAIALLLVYVYDQAGGNILSRIGFVRASAAETDRGTSAAEEPVAATEMPRSFPLSTSKHSGFVLMLPQPDERGRLIEEQSPMETPDEQSQP